MAFNPLSFLIAAPSLAGLACLLFGKRAKTGVKLLAFMTTLAALGVAWHVFKVQPLVWLHWPGTIAPLFRADTMASVVGLGIAFFAFLIAIYSMNYIEKHLGRFFGYYLLTLGASFGIAFANNLLLMAFCWGIVAVTFYLLVAMGETAASAAAAKKALIIIGATDSLLVLGICILSYITRSFSMNQIHLPLLSPLGMVAYLLVLSAALAKAGAFPFHSWFPDVAQDAPTPVTAYLPASLDKLLGIYLLARLSLDLVVMNPLSSTFLLAIGSFTIIFASSLAIFQPNMKRLLGYCAVSQVGYMIVGIGTATTVGIAGGLFHMLNHALYKACLFLSGGIVEKKTGTAELDKLGGLARYLPVTFAAFLVASLSVSGVPPFNGFVSKWMVYQGIVESAHTGTKFWVVWLVAAMFGSAFTLAGAMKLVHAVFLGRAPKGVENIREGGIGLLFPVVVLALMSLFFGIGAFIFPLPKLIYPIVGAVSFGGLWNPLMATALVLVAILLGVPIFLWKTSKNVRTCKPFIGGEDVEGFDKLSGVDFYETVKDSGTFSFLTKRDNEGGLDLYVQCRQVVTKLTAICQRLHNGVLPTYLVWPLLGMVFMFIIFFARP